MRGSQNVVICVTGLSRHSGSKYGQIGGSARGYPASSASLDARLRPGAIGQAWIFMQRRPRMNVRFCR